MAHPYHHSVRSARLFGGEPEDYQEIHDWFDETKKSLGNWRHRAMRHHSDGCFWCEEKFGTTIINSAGKKVPVRLVAEQHVTGDLGFIPTMAQWLEGLSPVHKWQVGDRSAMKGLSTETEEDVKNELNSIRMAARV